MPLNLFAKEEMHQLLMGKLIKARNLITHNFKRPGIAWTRMYKDVFHETMSCPRSKQARKKARKEGRKEGRKGNFVSLTRAIYICFKELRVPLMYRQILGVKIKSQQH
jgi:hypothetical protein